MTGLLDTPINTLLNELESGLKSIVIFSNNKSDLDQAALYIRDYSTENSTYKLEEFEAASYTLLINRLNALVSEKSMTIAGQAADIGSRISLWVIHNSQELNQEQLLLLGQMLIHLPGLNLRMILLHKGNEVSEDWKNATRNQTHIHDYTPKSIDPKIFLDTNTHLSNATNYTVNNSIKRLPQPSIFQTFEQFQRQLGIPSLLTFALSFLTAGWLLGLWTSGSLSKIAASIEASQVTSPAVHQAASTSEVNVTAGPRPTKINKIAPLTEQVTPAAKFAPLPLYSTPTDVETIINKSAIEEKPVRFAALRKDIEWLHKLNPEYFLISHGTFRKLENAKRMRLSHAELSKSRIVPILVTRKVAYSIITGPFRNQDRASNNLKRLDWSSDAKVFNAIRVKRLVNFAINRAE